MTEKQILQWIKTNLSEPVKQAIEGSIYSEEILGGMAMREVGFLISRYVTQGKTPEQIHLLMKGDYGQRAGEPEKIYHGFSYWQIDIGSYPDFINSGDWQDPFKSAKKCVEVLTEKREELKRRLISELQPNIAAYNCGSGNVAKAVRNGKSCDLYTYNHDYSKECLRFSEIYKSL